MKRFGRLVDFGGVYIDPKVICWVGIVYDYGYFEVGLNNGDCLRVQTGDISKDDFLKVLTQC